MLDHVLVGKGEAKRRSEGVLEAGAATHHILSCSKCHSPAASAEWSTRTTVRCGYCGFAEERDLTLDAGRAEAVSESEPYRPAPQNGGEPARTFPFDVSELHPRHSDPTTLDIAELHAAIARGRDTEGARALAEWEHVWVAVWLALMIAHAGDGLRARAALETALAATTTPAYRAILLAHLTQLCASPAVGAPGVAKKWVRAAPPIAIAGIESEVRAARAMIMLAEDDVEAAITATGGALAGRNYHGHAVTTAVAINVEARMRDRDPVAAEAIVASLDAQHVLPAALIPMTAYGLGLDTVRAHWRRLRKRHVVLSVLASAVPLAVVAFVRDVRPGPMAVAVLATTGITGALSWATFRSRTQLASKALRNIERRWLIDIAIPVVCAGIALAILLHVFPPFTDP